MIRTSRNPRVVISPTPRALRSMTMFEPSVVPCTACATSLHGTPARATSSSRPARHAAEGSGYVVSRLPVDSSPAGDWITRSVKVPPTSNPIRYGTGLTPAFGPGQDHAVRVAATRLVREHVLDRLAARREVGPIEE